MAFASYIPHLKKLGLAEREAAVYLAGLVLGASTVQQLARKAGIPRPTTYLIVNSLKQAGLMSEYNEGGKTLLISESPRHLEKLVERQEKEVQQRRQELADLLPEIELLVKAADDRPVVRYFSGRQGLQVLRQEMVRHSQRGEVWYNFSPVDKLAGVFGEEYIHYPASVAKQVRSKTIFTTRSPALREKLLSLAPRHRNERKFVPPNKFQSDCGLTIYRDCVAIAVFGDKKGGIIIESAAVATMLRELFDLAWEK